jgi:GntR family transcriptional regulator
MARVADVRGAPRYREVADQLQSRIAGGDLGPGQRIPSERAVADEFGISRMTARQAVELLVRRGVVYRRPGSGTFVAPARIEHSLQRLAGFSAQMREQGIEPSGRVLVSKLIQRVEPDARAALQLADGEAAWMMRRVRFGNGEPLVIETFHVPEPICPDLGRHDLTHGSLYDLMRDVYGVEPVSAHETIEPTACEPDEAAHLDTRPGAPAILVTRTTLDRRGRPVEYAHDVYRGDRSRFVIDLRS